MPNEKVKFLTGTVADFEQKVKPANKIPGQIYLFHKPTVIICPLVKFISIIMKKLVY